MQPNDAMQPSDAMQPGQPIQRSDAEIRQEVERILRETSRVDHQEVRVEVKDAEVLLTGAVDSAIEKRHARHLAEDAPGVRRVSDRLTVKTFVQRSDEELAEEVRHRLLRDPYAEGGQIEVYAGNGEIRLDGSIPTYHARKAAEDVAWWTPGVVNVENLLLVTEEGFVDVSPGEIPDA
jgi:osmotically-inducible protein OsmY